MSSIVQRLQELGVTLPQPAKPVANYVPWVRTGKLVFVSGQLPLVDGKVAVLGTLGSGAVSIEDGQRAARLCAINILAHVRDACGGDLERVRAVVKITGYVASTTDFTQHPQVVNGASDFIGQVFGEHGKHARAAVGVASLPLGAAVEVEAVVEAD